ncbi:putative elongator complex protein 1 [Colias croceus]|uniref:putative elongator complex protein 1 n=1 Tax=Colias crocea TaxID=72248 RepID=UPI001E27EC82|nr:putative elongator complex protein 1 [Colias croceus]
MRNLQLWRSSAQKLDYLCEEIACVCYGHHGGCPPGELFLCTHNLIVRCFSNQGRLKWSKDLSEISSIRNMPISMAYLSLVNTLSVGLSNGELFGMTETGANCELKGICEDGLLAKEWSHDQETLALVTKDYKVMVMSCTYDTVNQVNLISDEFGAKEFITVGWGKKETQFHGSEGKEAAKAQNDATVDNEATVSDKILISWKYHGSLFAVGFRMQGARRFKVFDKGGKLLYTSEKQPGVEPIIAWRPSGNFVATTQKLPDRYIVSFFEKNGLKHRDFEIPVTDIQVENILWSQDSEILTLVCKESPLGNQKILLFTSSNYHWYLKQTLTYNPHQTISKVLWDNDFDVSNNKKLHVLFKSGKYYTYTWVWDVNHSNGRCEKDDAVVGVIDGKKMLLSSFRHSIVPPPMANLEIETDNNIDSIVFLLIPQEDDEYNKFFVCSSNTLTFYDQVQKKPLDYKITKTIVVNKFDFPFQYYNWYWWKKNTVIVIALDVESNYKMIEYEILEDSLKIVRTKALPAAVVRIHSHPLIPKVYMHLETGKIIAYNSDGLLEDLAESFPAACPKFGVLPIGDLGYFIGLTHRGLLYLQDKVIMNNVASVFIHTDYFLITSMKNFMLCTKLTQEGLEAVIDYDDTESPDVYKRRVERGSRIIVVVPNDTRTVLQMPRGNLEVIEPRPLSLKIVGEHLNSLKYYEAFDLMRKQRINLNLMYDHNPQLFIENLDKFLDAIKNNSWLSLFLTDLENKDTTKTMYATSYINMEGNKDCDKKINFICNMIRDRLNTAPDRSSRVLPLLTTYVKQNTIQDLEKALLIIKELKNEELNGIRLPVSSDEALKYLLYIVDVNKLFDVALGMYDFDLVLLVANKSQKDPKEYMPMLNDLNGMDENYKRFTINKNLKRYLKAVECLIKCGPSKHDELKTFVKYHSLYRDALKMLTPRDYIYKQICDDFGLFLKLKKQFLEAGIMFERADNIEKAVECYKESLEWELALKLVQHLPRDEFKEICCDFVGALKQEKRHKEALRILEMAGDNEMEMIMYATENGEFKSAIRMCYTYDMHEMLETEVTPAILEEYNNLKDLLETNLANFKTYRDRLEVVRVSKKNMPARNDINIPYYSRDYDLYSDFGSTIGSSTGSSRSYRSSKNRRKHERKVASLKEGSQFEDTALVMALHTLVSSTFELRSHVREINLALCGVYKDEEARILQYLLEAVMQEMKESFNQIWTNNLVIEATTAVIAAELSLPEGVSIIKQGIATLEPHVRIAPVIQDVRWKLDLD